jgi:hypothetical protein
VEFNIRPFRNSIVEFFENSFPRSQIRNSFSGIKSASGGLNIMQPPLKFEIRRAQLVSAGIYGLKFKAAAHL